MWQFEYVLLFGLPENKLEFFDGGTPCVFPFLDRETADLHVENWVETIRRWKRVPAGPVDSAGFEFTRHPRPVHLRIGFQFDCFSKIHSSYWRPGVWGEQPAGQRFGMMGCQTHADVQLNLWKLFAAVCHEHGGVHSSRVDISLSDTASATPDGYYYQAGRDQCMIGQDYFRGPPSLIAEVHEPSTRALDRGPRKELYQRSGVPHLWLLEPAAETVETYALSVGRYELTGIHSAGESFRCVLFPGIEVAVDDLFDTQWKRHRGWWSSAEGGGGNGEDPGEPDEEPRSRSAPEWLLPPERRVGLEYLLVMGHPDRRHEIRDNRITCLLAFESEEEARLRFRHFAEDLCFWEGLPFALPKPVTPSLELAEAGRFRLARRGRYTELEVAVDGRRYRELLGVWANPEAWDWGDEEE